MRKASLIAAFAIIVVANVFALAHAARNRAGNADAEVTLTERELRRYTRPAADDNSDVTLYMEWRSPYSLPFPFQPDGALDWLNQQRLESLGFDCHVSPASPDAERYYQRQRARPVFIALEYNGAAWRALVEDYLRVTREPGHTPHDGDSADRTSYLSHLVPIDADLDPHRLRARHPDRATVIIVPAVVTIMLQPPPESGMKAETKRPIRIVGFIGELPASIHVPRPYSDVFRRINRYQGETYNEGPAYRVRVRYGRLLEPQVTGVELQEKSGGK